MTRFFRVAVMFALLCVGVTSRADASIMDWLDRLSGPGPFWGADVAIALKCRPVENGDKAPGAPQTTQTISTDTFKFSCRGERPDQMHFNWYMILGLSGTGRNNLNYTDDAGPTKAIGLFKMGSAVDYTALPWLDAGVGGGLYYFFGPRFVNFARPYIQPVRVSVRPLLIGWKSQPGSEPDYISRLRRRAWFSINFNVNVMPGSVNGSDFGAPEDPWRAENDVVTEFGIGIDVVKLFSKKN